MIAVIRISGMVKVPGRIQETLARLRLRRKYSLILLEDTEKNRKLLIGIRDYVAFGTVSDDTLLKLIEMRAVPIKGGKIDAKKIISELGKKKIEELGIKPFFRLHPPRGGIESKKHAGIGKGVLGDNKEKINNLIERML